MATSWNALRHSFVNFASLELNYYSLSKFPLNKAFSLFNFTSKKSHLETIYLPPFSQSHFSLKVVESFSYRITFLSLRSFNEITTMWMRKEGEASNIKINISYLLPPHLSLLEVFVISWYYSIFVVIILWGIKDFAKERERKFDLLKGDLRGTLWSEALVDEN